MKFTCARAELAEGLAFASAVVSAKSPKKHLQDVKITALAEGALELQATDLELSLRYRVELAEVSEPGEVLLPAGDLQRIVREVDGGTVTLETDPGSHSVTLRYADGFFRLVGDNPADFPRVPEFTSATAQVPAPVLAQMIERTAFACAREKTRYAINGVLLDVRSDIRLRLVGTDGRRMAMADQPIQAAEPAKAIVPARAMHQLSKLIAGESGSIALQISSSEIIARTPRAEFAARLVEGEYAPYERVIPEESTHRIELDRDLMLANTRRAGIMTTAEARTIRLALSPGEIVFSSYASGLGQSELKMAAPYEGEPVELAFNPDFLVEGLRVADEGSFTLEFTDASRAAKLTLGAGFMYVVMPVTL